MSLRARLVLAAAAAVTIAVVAAATGAYVLTARRLHQQFDAGLVREAEDVAGRSLLEELAEQPLPRTALPREEVFVQLVDAAGRVARPPNQRVDLPVTAEAVAIAASAAPASLDTVTIDGTDARVITRPARPGIALQLGRPLTEVEETLDSLRLVLVAVIVGGAATAAGIGLLVARTALAPVERLTTAAEHVAATQDLSASIPVDGDDEVARLARSFNAMLSALDRSRQAQRQLVADASHELRTPLATLRLNTELLGRGGITDPAARAEVVHDITTQIDELTVLVGDLIDLARDDPLPPEQVTDVRLDELVDAAVRRCRRLTSHEPITTALSPTVVPGQPGLLTRAVANVLDNAVKWSPPGAPIEVRVADGVVEVRDHGPGVGEEDLPHVFDRFYRSSAARSLPGSGLGLAIVRQVVEAHGGRAGIAAAPGGGAVVRLELPGAQRAVVDADAPGRRST